MKKIVISVVLAILITYVVLLVPTALVYWLVSLVLGINFLWKNTFIITGIVTIVRWLFFEQKVKKIKVLKLNKEGLIL